MFNLLIVAPFGILAFLVTLDFGLAIGAMFFVTGLAVLSLLAARYGPLEVEMREL